MLLLDCADLLDQRLLHLQPIRAEVLTCGKAHAACQLGRTWKDFQFESALRFRLGVVGQAAGAVGPGTLRSRHGE